MHSLGTVHFMTPYDHIEQEFRLQTKEHSRKHHIAQQKASKKENTR